MSEQLDQSPNPDVSATNRRRYNQYKWKFYRAEQHIAWLNDNSVKGVLKRAFSKTVDAAFFQMNAGQYRTERILTSPEKQLVYNADYYKKHEEAVEEDAIHEATAADVELNLTDAEAPETEPKAQPQADQDQPEQTKLE